MEGNPEPRVKKKVSSIKVDPDTWRRAKTRCANRNISLGFYIESLMKKDLEMSENQVK